MTPLFGRRSREELRANTHTQPLQKKPVFIIIILIIIWILSQNFFSLYISFFYT